MALTTGVWFKSSHSGGANNECVEVAHLGDGVGVRDTKDRVGGSLTLPPAGWAAFLVALKES
ncbi:DUF397 domain-containing protein [Amycolatopsis sp. cg5]|uniref:DUF397 domain-containing protein n=1 Tax=Amycolatopsis sp. cg5 TaxID=3238802 RepID=UPI0035255B77